MSICPAGGVVPGKAADRVEVYRHLKNAGPPEQDTLFEDETNGAYTE